MSRADDLYKTMRTMFTVLDELRAGTRISTKAIMERFQVEKAAALRYKKLLGEQLGVKTRVRGGRKVLEHLDSSNGLSRAIAVELALLGVPWLRGTDLHRQLAAVARDLRGSLAPEDQDELDRVVTGVYFKRREPARSAQHAKAMERLLFAIRHRRRCRMTYTKLEGSTNEYVVEPWFLAIIDDIVFVRGAKMPGSEPRLFDVNGIHEIEVLQESFTPPPRAQRDPQRTFQDTIGTYTTDDREPCEVKLLVRGAALVLLGRRPLHPTQAVEAADASGWAAVRVTAALCPELVAACLALLPDLRVVEPAALRQSLRDAVAPVLGSEWDPPDPRRIPRDRLRSR